MWRPFSVGWGQGGKGKQTNLVLDFQFVLMLCTTPPLVSLSPISCSGGKPLSISNGSRWSELDFAEKDKYKPVLLRLSLAGNLEKPLMFLYGTEWRERGYKISRLHCIASVHVILPPNGGSEVSRSIFRQNWSLIWSAFCKRDKACIWMILRD